MPVDNSVLLSDKFLTTIKQEFRLLAEYKMIQSESIPGCYVIPSANSSLLWFGVIYIRKGIFKGGIFRFSISISEGFPLDNCTPVVIFQQDNIFHPLVNQFTGILDVRDQFESWDSNENHIWQLLKYVKYLLEDIMHCSSLNESIQNQIAADLYHNNYDEFAEKIKKCVAESLEKIYENDASKSIDKHYLVFDKFDGIHETVLQNILDSSTNESQEIRSSDPFGVEKNI